jgi:hypothetical protein
MATWSKVQFASVTRVPLLAIASVAVDPVLTDPAVQAGRRGALVDCAIFAFPMIRTVASVAVDPVLADPAVQAQVQPLGLRGAIREPAPTKLLQRIVLSAGWSNNRIQRIVQHVVVHGRR